jgi:hypothetical protein
VRWRELLDHLRVPWVDRGHSASRGYIAIRCPWCGQADPSQHLRINEEIGAYHCLRGMGHGGYSPYYLLQALGVDRDDVAELLEIYGYTGTQRLPERPPPQPTGPLARRWATFRPAATDREACDYLASRGFWRPAATAQEFDLRIGPGGRWSGRLWFPLITSSLVGFTGRAMRDQQPRYMTESVDTCLYLPRAPSLDDRLVIIVEGPIDALRLADFVLDRYSILVVALCGLTITESKRLQFIALARLIPQFFVVLDSSVSTNNITRLTKEFRNMPFSRLLSCLRHVDLPPNIDDPAEMSGGEIEKWLQETGLAKLASEL